MNSIIIYLLGAVDFLRDQIGPLWKYVAFIFSVYLLLPRPNYKTHVKVPTIKFVCPWLPNIISRLRFNSYAPFVIYGGYAKILKPDGDLVVLSTKYAEELRQLPASTLNALEATFSDHVGGYTTILADSHLHTETIQKKLTPAIGRLIPQIISELDYAFKVELPDCDENLVAINSYEVFLRIVTRVGARIFIGDDLCREEKWLKASIDYTKNIFLTIALLRPFPDFLHPIVGRMLPSSRSLDRQLVHIKDQVLGPLIEKRRRMEAGSNPSYKKPDDFLQWMMDLAKTEKESHPHNLAHRLLGITSMAVVHTSAMSLTHSLYDLLVMKQWIQPLLEEIQIELSDWRDLTLSAGLLLPKGTHICMAAGPISRDSEVVEDPEVFDAFRFVKQGKGPTSGFVSTGPNHMHFGLGRYACPGRFFASVVMKLILSRFLTEYEFHFAPGQTERPRNILVGDKIVPNVSTPIFIKKRAL
ncbi:putative cytochrome P450 [Penicillium brasilianum]|uniref:Putative cytochrome P450 n=1 Tax=Penicillium brasilianum TaxID=104259 RepID=A0A1S9RLG1_PENBI|nr:putative cytochrome P450 [Penicillium brasilianum]